MSNSCCTYGANIVKITLVCNFTIRLNMDRQDNNIRMAYICMWNPDSQSNILKKSMTIYRETSEDTTVVIRSCKSKMERFKDWSQFLFGSWGKNNLIEVISNEPKK